ncbi:MAG: hypothetical protein PHY93_16660 [Bacteriovorax sp.]|nr:hypothetical protein [Bacteriovorax sp.]
MKLSKLLCLAFLVVCFSSCNEYEKLMGPALKAKMEDKNPNPVFDGEVEPAMPNPSDNDKTILGIDTNGNGIRDDVDIWINRTALDYNERMAMRQYARAEQDELRVCSLDLKNEASKVVTESMNSSYCLFALGDYKYFRRKHESRAEKIDGLTISTSERRNCLGYYDSHSYVAGGGNANSSFDHCKFKVENLQVLKTKFENLEEY